MVTEAKRRTVGEFEELIERHGTIGVIDMEGIPAPQLQQIRRDMRGDATLKMGRNTLILIALESIGLDELEGYVEGPTALLFTDADPFRLYRMIEAGRTSAPAGAGSVAPDDIVVKAGETGLPPGPIIGDFQQAGIPAAIQKGGVVVQEDTVVAEEGDVIDARLADALNKLGMEPLEIGLKLRGVYEAGQVYEPDVLAVDEEEYASKVRAAAASAFNLAVNTAYPAGKVLPALVGRAFAEARSLAVEAGIPVPEVIEDVLAGAETGALGLASHLGGEFLDEGAPERVSSSGGADAAEEKEKPAEPEEEKT